MTSAVAAADDFVIKAQLINSTKNALFATNNNSRQNSVNCSEKKTKWLQRSAIRTVLYVLFCKNCAISTVI